MVQWFIEPDDIGSISTGLLTTDVLDFPTATTITTEYNDGEVTLSAEKDVAILKICPSGSALEFDGVNDYVDLGNDESLDVTEFTWALWIKRGETSYTNERALISNIPW